MTYPTQSRVRTPIVGKLHERQAIWPHQPKETREQAIRRYWEAGRHMAWIGRVFGISRQAVGHILGSPMATQPEHPMFRRRLNRLRVVLRRLPRLTTIRTEAQLDELLGFPSRYALKQVGQWERVYALFRERRKRVVQLNVIDRVRKLAKELGRTPTMRELKQAGIIQQSGVQLYFGTIRQLQRESGCFPTPRGWPGHLAYRTRKLQPEDVADVI